MIWNSPEMAGARAWIEAYYSRSRRHSASDARKYLDQLSRSSADELLEWLKDFYQMRQGLQMQESAVHVTRTSQLQRRQLETYHLEQTLADTRAESAQQVARQYAVRQLSRRGGLFGSLGTDQCQPSRHGAFLSVDGYAAIASDYCLYCE
jgi:hypothetical protein